MSPQPHLVTDAATPVQLFPRLAGPTDGRGDSHPPVEGFANIPEHLRLATSS